MASVKRTSNESGNEYDQLGMKILQMNRAILSLTINDDKGEVFGKAYTKEYERKYMDAAKDLKSERAFFRR